MSYKSQIGMGQYLQTTSWQVSILLIVYQEYSCSNWGMFIQILFITHLVESKHCKQLLHYLPVSPAMYSLARNHSHMVPSKSLCLILYFFVHSFVLGGVWDSECIGEWGILGKVEFFCMCLFAKNPFLIFIHVHCMYIALWQKLRDLKTVSMNVWIQALNNFVLA